MTSVNVTTDGKTVVVEDTATSIVSVTTTGPQGPAGLGVDEAAKVDKSVVYYDSSSGKFKADATWTIDTIVLGGNF